jgi:hypothetical protein
VSRNVPGAFGGHRSPWLPHLVALAVASLLLAACSPAERVATFALSIRNAGDASVRLKVLVTGAPPPASDLLIPARSGILQTEPVPMSAADQDEVGPVVIEVYTDTCALLTSLTVGEGRTRIDIAADRSITTSAASDDGGAGAVAPEFVPACDQGP